jgi:hypothetical protein
MPTSIRATVAVPVLHVRTDAMFWAPISPALVRHHMMPTIRPGGGILYSAKSANTEPKIGARPIPLTIAPVHRSHGAAPSAAERMIKT